MIRLPLVVIGSLRVGLNFVVVAVFVETVTFADSGALWSLLADIAVPFIFFRVGLENLLVDRSRFLFEQP